MNRQPVQVDWLPYFLKVFVHGIRDNVHLHGVKTGDKMNVQGCYAQIIERLHNGWLRHEMNGHQESTDPRPLFVYAANPVPCMVCGV